MYGKLQSFSLSRIQKNLVIDYITSVAFSLCEIKIPRYFGRKNEKFYDEIKNVGFKRYSADYISFHLKIIKVFHIAYHLNNRTFFIKL